MYNFSVWEVVVMLITTISFMFSLQPFIQNIVACGVVSAVIPLGCFVSYKTLFRNLIKRRWQKYVVIAAEFAVIFGLIWFFRLVR
jgi:hypothetical protein